MIRGIEVFYGQDALPVSVTSPTAPRTKGLMDVLQVTGFLACHATNSVYACCLKECWSVGYLRIAENLCYVYCLCRYLIDNHTAGSVTILGPENTVTSESQVWTVKKHE